MENEDNKNNQQPQSEAAGHQRDLAESDAGTRSLSDALKISFVVLKLIMIALVIFFITSGFETVDSDEEAIVLRFGKMKSEVLKSRSVPYWIFPYPIEEMIKIPVKKKVDLDVESFWYFQTEAEKLSDTKKQVRGDAPLRPTIDGYCLVRGEAKEGVVGSLSESDYNIVHCKWRLIYQIDNPKEFFRNVYVQRAKPGEVYFDVIKTSINPLIQDIIESSVVTAMVHYTIDEAMFEKVERVSEHVRRLVQARLDNIKSGITVVSIQLFDITWPLQVDRAFQESITAFQIKQTRVNEARTYSQKILNEAGGPVTVELLAVLKDPNASEEKLEFLWSQLAGEAQKKITEARAYRTSVVKNAKANAEYLREILSEYRKRPQLVIQEIYKTAMEQILSDAEEKIIMQPVESQKGKEVRILYNRDPLIRTKKSQESEKSGK